MASVTFPTAYGGDGNTYTDDANPATGLANGGHRLRFVPCLAGAVEMAAWTKQMADSTYADRLQAATDSAKAQGARSAAEAAATTATGAAESATASAQQAAAHYPSVTEALAATESGSYFQVPEGGYVQLYINDGGSAKPVLKMASQEELMKLNARPDPLLTSLLF